MRRLAALTNRQRLAAAIAACAALAAVLLILSGDESRTASGVEVVEEDPFAFDPAREQEFLERGRDGLAHILYALSPGGVEATAERTLRFEDEIEASARREEVDPRTLEALVFLESAGRPDVIAGEDPEAAAGLGQILPGTATDLLGMSVDLAASKRLTKRIASELERAERARNPEARARARRAAEEIAARRRAVDDRFDPELALAGAARYLALAEDRFGREDLALASYHMGIGNLESVIETYLSPEPVEETVRATVEANDISYPRLYFDSTPLENPRTHGLLEGLGDDSRHYLFRVEAAREIMRLFREDRAELRRLAELHGNKASGEEVLRPPDRTGRFEDAGALADAYDSGELAPLRRRSARLGYRAADEMGELAPRLEAERALYRGLRPEALAALVYIAERVRSIAGPRTMLTLTSTVRDAPYQELLARSNIQATDGYSLHTTGYAFDVARELGPQEEHALVAALERLRALNVLDWVLEPGAIHVTVGPEAEALLAE